MALAEQAVVEKTIIYGSYSDDISIQFRENVLRVVVKRYFKDEKSEMLYGNRLKLRLIGFEGLAN